MSGWCISAPFLTGEQREKAVTASGLSDGADPGGSAKGLLLGLQHLAHIYGGTVPAGKVARRREHNRRARKSRRINRGRR